jgi:hypothetical protein
MLSYDVGDIQSDGMTPERRSNCNGGGEGRDISPQGRLTLPAVGKARLRTPGREF